MSINKKPSGDGVELFLTGRVDGAMANEMEIEILEAIRSGTKTLYLNMAGPVSSVQPDSACCSNTGGR